MTYYSDSGFLPPRVTIKCPHCKARAQFAHCTRVEIKLRADIDFFKNSDLFDYYKMEGGHAGHRWNCAVYYPGLHGDSTGPINNLPPGYSPEDWSYQKAFYLYQQSRSMGSIRCENCNSLHKYTLSWPEDAYYTIEYKGHLLWAFDRESTVMLRDYIATKRRTRDGYWWYAFLDRIPSIFMRSKARDTVIKKLEKLLKD